ncbi:TonB-dependent receptor [Mangrovimonas sp. AS39]|uniref:TonB-dependent receptor n=1 Tax=Mangrovimonas futianensis TaxID=2895523 RepID=UPI001E4708A6|nr:TonB-dependent receptor [Mangrovimonas futianensis]MCF1191179.1 TonB-dependent receptor [Mangrovimonas futianensis]MCF1194874.1 TonB-dependent receptor [Mangrovimonas futianensis]
MRRFTLILLAFVITQFSFAQASLQGIITETNQEPIPNAYVTLQGTSIGTMTNDEGEFLIKDIPFGRYEVRVSNMGFGTQSQTIDFSETKVYTLNVSLEFNNDLNAVEVFGRRLKNPDKIEALTRLPLEPYKQIQSISVIGEKLIENQGGLSISEVTKNVPGVYTFATYGNKRESMSSRGFRGIPILKNGVRVHSDFRGVGILTDMQGVDNIQVLKGSASVTQGVATDLGSPGGVINIVTKTPKYEFGGQASMRVGSFGQVRPTFDVYGPMDSNNKVAYRINGALERANSYRDGISSERFYINPSFQWKVDDKSRFTVEMDYFDDSRTPDVGTINLAENDTNAIYDLPYDQFLGFANDRSITQNSTYSIRFDRELSDQLTLKAAFYKSHLQLDDKGASLGSAIEQDGETIYNLKRRGYSVSNRTDDNSVLQFDLIGQDIYTGKVKHTLQIGFDYRTTKYSTSSQSVSTVDTIDVFGSVSNKLPNLSLGDARLGGGKTRSLGFVAQDVVSWTDWFQTFVGLRYSTTETIGEVENTMSDAFNPLGGIVVSPTKNINIFASYTNSSYPRTAARLGENGEELGNERYDQLEAGVKTTWLEDRLRFNLTLFRINNKDINLPVYDDTWSTILYYQKGGNDQRQGIEVELTGRVLENLEVIAGYSYIDAQYKEHTAFVSGSAPLNTPKHTANLYGNYQFRGALEGFSIGAGAYYTGERPINDWSSGAVTHEGIVPGQKPFNVDAYTLVNLQAGYRINNHWNVRLLFNNVFNEIGYNAYRTSFINQTDPRNFSGVLTYQF